MLTKKSIYVIIMLLAIGFLSSLSYWQYTRSIWKENLIAQIQTQIQQSYIPFTHENINDNAIFRITEIKGNFKLDLPILAIPNRIKNGKGGRHIYAFFQPNNSKQTILVNLGFMEGEQTNSNAPNITLDDQQYTIKAQIRRADPRNAFTPDNQPHQALYYHIDHAMIAQYYNITLNPFLFYIQTPNIIKNITPIDKDIQLKNNHLQYAITWFSLALIGIIILLSTILRKFFNTES